MTKILIFIDWFVPGYKAGGPITSNANLIDHLEGAYEFYVMTRDTDYCEQTPYPGVTSDAWNTLPNGAKVYYFSSRRLGIRNIVRISKSVAFDVVYINGIYSFYFSLFPLIWFTWFTRKKVVVAARGMLSDHTFSAKKSKKKLFYALARFLGLYRGVTFHATNPNEAEQIRKNVGFKGIIKVAPNLPPKGKTIIQRTIIKTPGELRLISIARIAPEKNTLFAVELIERMMRSEDGGQKGEDRQWATVDELQTTEEKGKIVFDLYGTIYSQPYWEECQEVIRRLPPNTEVNFCGTLEKEKIADTLQRYHFLFLPTMGENYGHSIVESLLAGCPVIISDQTPWKNLEEGNRGQTTDDGLGNTLPKIGVGWDLPLQKPEMFVHVLEHCAAMGQEAYDAMSKEALEYGRQILKNQDVMKANQQLFE